MDKDKDKMKLVEFRGFAIKEKQIQVLFDPIIINLSSYETPKDLKRYLELDLEYEISYRS